jgi:hypothetical protein
MFRARAIHSLEQIITALHCIARSGQKNSLTTEANGGCDEKDILVWFLRFGGGSRRGSRAEWNRKCAYSWRLVYIMSVYNEPESFEQSLLTSDRAGVYYCSLGL